MAGKAVAFQPQAPYRKLSPSPEVEHLKKKP